jgi:hypothetical protein
VVESFERVGQGGIARSASLFVSSETSMGIMRVMVERIVWPDRRN